MTPAELVRFVKKYERRWLGKPGVRGVGGSLAGESGWLCVYVDDPATARTIEPSVDGICVEAVVRGTWALAPVE
jgi:hypothetical protein